jgi:hypothetical protein
VIDITNPASPTLAGSCYTPGYAYDVAISGDYAYVADYTYGLQVINITNPASPTLAGYYDTPGGAHGVAISGEYAYVADRDSGLQVIGVFQRRYDTGANIGRSLEVDNSDNTIVGARLSSTQTDSIRWQVSANGGANWMTILPGSWRAFAFPGSDLRWRSTHYYAGGGINPSCTDLEIAWLYSSAMINDIADIADDQGGWVRLYFTRSWYDFANASSPIVSYYIWRRIDDASLVAKAAREGVYLDGEDASAALGLPKGFPCTNESYRTVKQGQRVFLLSGGDSPTWESSLQGLPPGTWEVVGSVPALQQDQYIAAVPTLGDSTGSGTEYTVCCVSAHTTTPSVWYVSSPDSGYSVDNLAPAPPVNLRMTSPTALAWDESKDKDFKYFTVYGSGVPGLDSTATLIGYTIGTAMDVTGDAYEYYHVTASDFSGNEGDASSVENAYSGVNTDESIPAVFALRQNRPNPFSSKTSVAFDLPMGCAVSLRVFDAQGRQVKTLIDQTYPSGRHSVGWAGDDEAGNAVGSGIYFVRMEAGGFKATSKMLLTR